MKKSLFSAFAMMFAMGSFAQSTVLFEGSKVTGNWSGYEEFPASNFADAAEGDKIVVNVADILTGDNMWASCQLAKSDWSELVAYPLYSHPEATEVTFTLSAEEAAEIKSNGVIVRGCFYTIEKVTFVSDQGDDPQPSKETVIWTGSWETTSWGGMQELAWGGHDWSGFKEGDKIAFTVEGIGANPVLKPADSSWIELSCGFLNLKSGDQVVTITPDNADIAKLKENGLVISGHNIRLTKVAIITKGSSTGVENVTIMDQNDNQPVMYDLYGRRVKEAKGLVIVNGKKIYFK